MSGLWRLPETVVVAIGGRAGARAVLLHHSLRNTVHALYLALDHALYLALDHPSLHLALDHASLHLALLQVLPQHAYTKLLTREDILAASRDGGVRVYRRCLYCNNGDPDVQLLHNLNIYSPDLLWDDLFQERFEDLMGNKMRIVAATPAFPFVDYERVSENPGTAVVLRDSLDARLIRNFAAKLNFTFDVHEAVNRTWGVETNGTFTGTIGLLQREQMDFSTITAPTAKRLRVVEYINGYPSEPFTITSLKPTLLPKYLAFIRPFEGELWVALVVSVVVWGATLWLLQRAWQKVAGGRRVELSTIILYGYGALLQNLPSEPSTTTSGRMLVGWWLVSCLIVTTGFTSSLVAHLTVQGRSRPLETFQDLVNQPGWRWATESWMMTEAIVDYFVKHPNPVVNHIYHNMEVMQVEEALKKVLAGGFSFIGFKTTGIITIAAHYTDLRGNTPFFISKNIPVLAAFGWCLRQVLVINDTLLSEISRNQLLCCVHVGTNKCKTYKLDV
ncbi:probable glutamate receptor [Procambarus clarkii]|uniref:probable glutamate receptor n=1 Tax=Procambarus clarkii TaxID=6728 RepID=UPI003744A557